MPLPYRRAYTIKKHPMSKGHGVSFAPFQMVYSNPESKSNSNHIHHSNIQTEDNLHFPDITLRDNWE